MFHWQLTELKFCILHVEQQTQSWTLHIKISQEINFTFTVETSVLEKANSKAQISSSTNAKINFSNNSPTTAKKH